MDSGRGQVTQWSEPGADHLSEEQWRAGRASAGSTAITGPRGSWVSSQSPALAKPIKKRLQISPSTAEASGGCRHEAQGWIRSTIVRDSPDPSLYTWNGKDLEDDKNAWPWGRSSTEQTLWKGTPLLPQTTMPSWKRSMCSRKRMRPQWRRQPRHFYIKEWLTVLLNC